MTRPACSSRLGRPLLAWEAKRPAIFYPALALLSIQLADMLREVRTIVTFAVGLLRALGRH